MTRDPITFGVLKIQQERNGKEYQECPFLRCGERAEFIQLVHDHVPAPGYLLWYMPVGDRGEPEPGDEEEEDHERHGKGHPREEIDARCVRENAGGLGNQDCIWRCPDKRCHSPDGCSIADAEKEAGGKLPLPALFPLCIHHARA